MIKLEQLHGLWTICPPNAKCCFLLVLEHTGLDSIPIQVIKIKLNIIIA